MSDILQTIFSPACLFTGYAIALPIQILYDGLLAYIIPPKSKRAYWVIVIAVAMVLILFRPLYPTEIRGMLGIFQSIVLPICLMTGSVPKRVIVCSLAMVLMAVAELTGAVIWVSSTGLEMMNDQLALTYAPLTIFMGLVGYGLVMTPAMIVMGKVVHRFFPETKKDRRGRRASGTASPVWMRRLALFPLMQVPLIFIVLGICFSVTRGETAFVVASTAILLLCTAIDALLFLQMRRSAERQRAEIKAALLEERLAGYLRELTAVQELLGDTARLRHDLFGCHLATPRGCATICATAGPWWRRCASAETSERPSITLKVPLSRCARCGWMLPVSSRMRSTEFPWGRVRAPRERKGSGRGSADDGAGAQTSIYAAVRRDAHSNALLLASAEGHPAEIEEGLLGCGGVPLPGGCAWCFRCSFPFSFWAVRW